MGCRLRRLFDRSLGYGGRIRLILGYCPPRFLCWKMSWRIFWLGYHRRSRFLRSIGRIGVSSAWNLAPALSRSILSGRRRLALCCWRIGGSAGWPYPPLCPGTRTMGPRPLPPLFFSARARCRPCLGISWPYFSGQPGTPWSRQQKEQTGQFCSPDSKRTSDTKYH